MGWDSGCVDTQLVGKHTTSLRLLTRRLAAAATADGGCHMQGLVRAPHLCLRERESSVLRR
jgi:hypothetical protein